MTITIERFGTPLKDWDIRINYGIKTGCNEAFIINEQTRAKLIAEDPKSAEIIRPILRGRDIKRNGYEFAGLYVILAIFDSHKWLETKYPAIYKHLLQFEEKLKKRGQYRYLSSGKVNNPSSPNYPGYPGMHHWLELDNNPRQKNMDDFSMQKIVFPAIMSKDAFFAYDTSGAVVIAPGNIITGSIDLKKLLLILTSVGYWALRHFYMGGGIEGELKVNRLQSLPIPKNIGVINDTHDIYKSYNLTNDEIHFIENS